MALYSDTATVRAARAQYFAANGFSEESYGVRWVKLQAGPVPLYFLNTQARVRAVRYHDIHHVLTEYETTWTGEAEIGAWEVASGCAHHYAAWLLNLQAMAIGLVINSEAVFRAFVRGRRTANLYRAPFNDELLATAVGTLRDRLHLNGKHKASALEDRIAFAGWALLSVVTLIASIFLFVIAPFLLVWSFFL